MKNALTKHKYFLILLALLTIYHLGTIQKVPFHPDESTQIYMSRDFNELLRKPLSMAWETDQNLSPVMRLRQLDAPITRYLIGLGRSVFGLQALPENWDWGKSWEENQREGAYPSQRLLLIARISVSLLLPITLTLFYSSLSHIKNKITGLVGAVLLGINPLLLLHGRRAMAESAIIFGITFFIWALQYREKRPWLMGLAAALAYNAKQSTLAIFPVGIIAVSWIHNPTRNLSKLIKNLFLYLGIFLLITFLLNPLVWKRPIQAFLSSWQARIEFTGQQVATIRSQQPNRILQGLPQRLLSLINNLYLNKPSVADVGNYLQNTQESSEAYFDIPGSSFGRGIIPGSIFLTLTAGGVFFSLSQIPHLSSSHKRSHILLLLATLAQTSALLIVVPIPWQRYVMPLLPFATLWIALGMSPFFDFLSQQKEIDSHQSSV